MFLTIVVFILILGVLIFVHELGHFLTAKKSGVKVEEFGFGFPPRIFGVKKGETVYSLNWIPLGGFVKIKGETGEAREEADSFSHQPFRKRALILSAGVLEKHLGEVKVQIAGLVEGGPAERAGLKAGDQILALNGQTMAKEEEVVDYVQSHQEELIIVQIKRSLGEVKEFSVLPEEIIGATQKKALGINLIQTAILKYGFFESWYQGARATASLLLKIILAFYQLLKNLFLGLGVSAGLAGPVGVAVMTGQVVEMGLRYIWQFTALLSLNLAVINFLPFPALDGGRFLFLVIEKLRRRPNNQQLENVIHNIGFSLLLLLIAVVTYRDLLRYGEGFIGRIKDLF